MEVVKTTYIAETNSFLNVSRTVGDPWTDTTIAYCSLIWYMMCAVRQRSLFSENFSHVCAFQITVFLASGGANV